MFYVQSTRWTDTGRWFQTWLRMTHAAAARGNRNTGDGFDNDTIWRIVVIKELPCDIPLVSQQLQRLSLFLGDMYYGYTRAIWTDHWSTEACRVNTSCLVWKWKSSGNRRSFCRREMVSRICNTHTQGVWWQVVYDTAQ